MNLTCQISEEFDLFYIVLFRTLDCNAHCNQCEYPSFAYIAYNKYCEHTIMYRLHSTCDTVNAYA